MVGKWSTLCFELAFGGLNGLTGLEPVSCGKDVPAFEFWKFANNDNSSISVVILK